MAGMGDGYVGTSADWVRIRRLEKQREEEQQRMDELRKKSSQGLAGLLQFGAATSEKLETAFKQQTVGLVTREQFVETRATLKSKIEEVVKANIQKQKEEEEDQWVERRLKRRAAAPTAKLSFLDDFEGEEDDDSGGGSGDDEAGDRRESGTDAGSSKDAAAAAAASGNSKSSSEAAANGAAGSPSSTAANEAAGFLRKRKLSKLGKDPTVETSFLPDREREAQEQADRERLKAEWIKEQERVKNEPLEITYSYWDGAGHRRVIKVRKGDSIADFLKAVQQQLAAEFREVRTTAVENLLYIKEDLIIPHQYTFYELIVNRARGKSGPLFHFDVHEDIRTSGDARIEKDESHAGKVVERHWYDKNKHIFPASRWEIYDPTKKWDRYTIHGT